MSTGIFWSEGTGDAKSITTHGKMDMGGAAIPTRMVHTFNDDGTVTMEMFMKTPAGEQKHMTQTYTKAKEKAGTGMR